MNGDELWTRTLFLNANKVAFCGGQYIYIRRKDSISNKLNAKSFNVFPVQFKLLTLIKDNKFSNYELKVWKKDTLFKLRFYTLRYILNQQLLSESEKANIKKILREAWILVFYQCWLDFKFYKSFIKMILSYRDYKNYNYLKNKLQAKGMICS